MITIRKAEVDDAVFLALHMRKEDVAEVAAASGLCPEEALIVGMSVSRECYSVLGDGTPIAMFGVCPDENASVGRVWMLGSDAIHAHRFDFLRKSLEWVEHFHNLYPVLHNYIDARNTVHIKWLQWLGFTFIKELPDYGMEQELFYHFVRIKSHV